MNPEHLCQRPILPPPDLKKVVTVGSFYVRCRCNQTEEKNLVLSVDTKLTFAPILGMVDDDDGGNWEFQQTIKELAE